MLYTIDQLIFLSLISTPDSVATSV